MPRIRDQYTATDRRARITKDVSILRHDHVSIKGKLLGVWQVFRIAAKAGTPE